MIVGIMGGVAEQVGGHSVGSWWIGRQNVERGTQNSYALQAKGIMQQKVWPIIVYRYRLAYLIEKHVEVCNEKKKSNNNSKLFEYEDFRSLYISK